MIDQHQDEEGSNRLRRRGGRIEDRQILGRSRSVREQNEVVHPDIYNRDDSACESSPAAARSWHDRTHSPGRRLLRRHHQSAVATDPGMASEQWQWMLGGVDEANVTVRLRSSPQGLGVGSGADTAACPFGPRTNSSKTAFLSRCGGNNPCASTKSWKDLAMNRLPMAFSTSARARAGACSHRSKRWPGRRPKRIALDLLVGHGIGKHDIVLRIARACSRLILPVCSSESRNARAAASADVEGKSDGRRPAHTVPSAILSRGPSPRRWYC